MDRASREDALKNLEKRYSESIKIHIEKEREKKLKKLLKYENFIPIGNKVGDPSANKDEEMRKARDNLQKKYSNAIKR